jgi:hypothetical protein
LFYRRPSLPDLLQLPVIDDPAGSPDRPGIDMDHPTQVGFSILMDDADSTDSNADSRVELSSPRDRGLLHDGQRGTSFV